MSHIVSYSRLGFGIMLIVLLVGAILSPARANSCCGNAGDGTVKGEAFHQLPSGFQSVQFGQVVKRAKSRRVQLIAVFATSGVIVLGRLRHNRATSGKQIAEDGIYRDPVRKAPRTLCKSKWIALVELDGVGRYSLGWGVWALPFLTVLATSERHDHSGGHRHKCLTDWSRAFAQASATLATSESACGCGR